MSVLQTPLLELNDRQKWCYFSKRLVFIHMLQKKFEFHAKQTIEWIWSIVSSLTRI